MMSLPEDNRLAEALTRGQLTTAEQAEADAFLARHPECRAEWEEELSLSGLLRQVPDVPVSSNFTARVIDACHQSERRPARARAVGTGWSRWLPRFAAGTAALGLAVLSYYQHQLAERRELAQNLAEVAQLPGGASIELLQDFEAIQKLNYVPTDVDRELIAALQ
ncbi:MAG: anti-sigma factor [Verrucomicrobiia bacterium]